MSSGDGIMNKIGGGLRAAHDMGESIRGTINSAFDQGGEVIAGRGAGSSTGTAPTNTYTSSRATGPGTDAYTPAPGNGPVNSYQNDNTAPATGTGAGMSGTSTSTNVAQKGMAEMHEGFDRLAGRDKNSSMMDAGTHNLPPGASSRAQPPELPPRSGGQAGMVPQQDGIGGPTGVNDTTQTGGVAPGSVRGGAGSY